LKKFYALLFTLSVGAATAQAATKTVKHTIKNNETLYTIAHKNHTTIAEVRKANHLKKGDILKLGRVLTVPVDTYFPNKKKKATAKKVAKVSKSVKKTKIAKRTKTVKRSKSRIRVSKTKTVRNSQRRSRILSSALKSHSKPFASNRVKRARKSNLDDILFTSYETDYGFSTQWSSSNDRASKIINLAKQKLGNKYVWGAVGQRNTFDCSGLTKYVYRKQGINIPRTSYNQAKYGKSINRSNLQPGDLVFFDTSKKRKGYVNHVGIYIGNNEFLHASSAKKKVVITSLNAKFYSQRYKGARRPS